MGRGRPPGIAKSKLDKHRDKIIKMLKHGVTKVYIAKLYGVVPGTLSHWLKRHGLDNIEPVYDFRNESWYDGRLTDAQFEKMLDDMEE